MNSYFEKSKRFIDYCNEILAKKNQKICIENIFSEEFDDTELDLFLENNDKVFYISTFIDYEDLLHFLVPFFNYISCML